MARHQYNSDYARYLLERSWWRRQIRRLYFAHALKWVRGSSIDFGCGGGELLKRLPPGSFGYEINEIIVKTCQAQGLPVRLYRPEEDRYDFTECPPGQYTTFIMSHVLEHMETARDVFAKIARSCERLKVERIILIVPGRKGFSSDKTHRTFVDMKFIADNQLGTIGGFHMVHRAWFPIPWAWGGAVFTHNELMMIYDRGDLCHD